jgi:hypothetical protein
MHLERIPAWFHQGFFYLMRRLCGIFHLKIISEKIFFCSGGVSVVGTKPALLI